MGVCAHGIDYAGLIILFEIFVGTFFLDASFRGPEFIPNEFPAAVQIECDKGYHSSYLLCIPQLLLGKAWVIMLKPNSQTQGNGAAKPEIWGPDSAHIL